MTTRGPRSGRQLLDELDVGDGLVLKDGVVFRTGRSRDRWLCQWIYKARGKPWVVAYGPLDSRDAKGGKVFYAGAVPTSRKDLSGRRVPVKPTKFKAG